MAQGYHGRIDWQAQARETAEFIKSHYTIYDLWELFHLDGNPRKKTVDSPWAAHGSMSFSIFANGRAFKDWSTGETGDVITFFGKIHQLGNNREALKKFAAFLKLDDRQRREEIERRPVVASPSAVTRPLKIFYDLDCYLPRHLEPLTLDVRSAKNREQTYHYATIRPGTDYEIRQLAALRTIPYRGLLAAHERGLLRFGDFKRQPAFFVLDDARYAVQARRLDGQPYQVPRERKGRQVCEEVKGLTLLNSHPGWTIGLADARQRKDIYFVEGGPDFLATIASRCTVERPDEGFVCMLGAEQNIHPDALPLFKGKQIHLLMQHDAAGRRACNRWRDQLTGAGAIIKAVYFPKAEGRDINDMISTYYPDPFAAPQKKTAAPTLVLASSGKETQHLAAANAPMANLVKTP